MANGGNHRALAWGAILGFAVFARGQSGSSDAVPGAAGEVRAQKDVVFATVDDKPLKLDVYSPAPKPGQEATHPVLIRIGPLREAPAGAAMWLLDHAYTLVYAGYLPEGDPNQSFSLFPQDVQAAKAAIRYVRGHAKTLGVDPEKIGLWGTGHGATVAALTAFTPDEKNLNGSLGDFATESSAVRTLCLFEGITDWRYAELYGDETVNFPGSAAYQLFGGNTKAFPDTAPGLGRELLTHQPRHAHGDAGQRPATGHASNLRRDPPPRTGSLPLSTNRPALPTAWTKPSSTKPWRHFSKTPSAARAANRRICPFPRKSISSPRPACTNRPGVWSTNNLRRRIRRGNRKFGTGKSAPTKLAR